MQCYKHILSALPLAVVITTSFFLVSPCESHGSQIILPEIHSPSQDELLKAARADTNDATLLMRTLWRLSSHAPGAADADLLRLDIAEESWFQHECQRRGAIGEQEFKIRMDKDLVATIKKELEEKRLHDPRRQIDAIARRLEDVGTASQLTRLFLLAKQTKAPGGAWRFYATIQGILIREDPAVVADTPDIPVNLLAPLLRDLPPSKSGTLGMAFWKRHAPALATRLWLAWAISDLDPKKAFDIFSGALGCHDPGVRVFAGMGILRITEAEDIPFSLLASPDDAKTTRSQWLKQRTVHRPSLFHFSSPLLLPIIKKQRGTRVDLNWVREDATVSKKMSDVWPTVQWVLPDGTFCVCNRAQGSRVLSLATQQGDVSVTFPGSATWSFVWPSPLGGFLGSAPPHTAIPVPTVAQSGEFSPMGELVWACNTRARHLSAGTRGTVLLVRYGLVEVVNRRGDVLWKVDD
ncbi:hypothetical protein ACFLS1_10580, partial [Verrucomicrobiota bacterium]